MCMDILSIIGRIQEKKRSDKITPDHVPEVELLNTINTEVRKELDDLLLAGKIGMTKIINSNAVYIKE